MITTYVYDPGFSPTRKSCDPGEWLTWAPESPVGWDLPGSTHVGSASAAGDLVLAVWLSVPDGVVGHAAFDLRTVHSVERCARELCESAEGKRVEDLGAILAARHPWERDNLRSGADLAREAFAAALARPKPAGDLEL